MTDWLRSGAPAASARGADTLTVRDTLGGYVLSHRTSAIDTNLLAEAVLKFFGLLTILMSGALWLMPGALFSGDVLVMKLALTAAFLSTGAALYWHADRGFHDEVHVDTVHREIRIATRNVRDRSRTRARIPMRDVESCFLRRGGGAAQLCLRVRGRSHPLDLVRAGEPALIRLHERLSRDIQAPRARVAARAA